MISGVSFKTLYVEETAMFLLTCMAALVRINVLADAKFRVDMWSFVLLNITKIQQLSVMPLDSNLMLHACCPSIRDSYLETGP